MISHTKTNIIISDCSDFTLIQYVATKVDGIAAFYHISNVSSGECFFACFNSSGCYTFSYDAGNHNCRLYTGCGASCNLIEDNAFTTYVRECAPTLSGGTRRMIPGIVF